MPGLLLDTHAFIWYLADASELSAAANTAIEQAVLQQSPVYVSAISLAEALYLSEKGRISLVEYQKLLVALADPQSELNVIPFTADHAAAMSKIPRSIVPDMPDRLIAATAMHLAVPLVTRDAQIRSFTANDLVTEPSSIKN